MIQDEIYKFNIYGKYPKLPYFLFIIVGCLLIVLINVIYASFTRWKTIDELVIGSIIICTLGTIGFGYAGYFFIMLKTLQIDNEGVRYIFDKKIKIDLSWREITKIETHTRENKTFYLLINGAEKRINFNSTDIGASKEDLQRAFYELLRYQPQYHFQVEDEVGWSRQ